LSLVRKPPSSEKIGKTGAGTATEEIFKEIGTLLLRVPTWTLNEAIFFFFFFLYLISGTPFCLTVIFIMVALLNSLMIAVFMLGLVSSQLIWDDEFLNNSDKNNTLGFGVINGNETDYKQFLGVVGVVFNNNGNPALCSGSFIDPEVLLTAGHCCRGDSSNLATYEIKGGAQFGPRWTGGIFYSGVINKRFIYQAFSNDICLLHLNRQYHFLTI
jgi:hypothetical protein